MPKPIIGRPKDLKKRHAILEAARELFLELGYEGSSMDKIAKSAGVSKLTVYNHFQDKEHLFSAAIERACEQRLPKHLFEINSNSKVEEVLQDVGCSFLCTLYSPEALKLTNLMSSLVAHNPALVHLFYQAGPERTHQNMMQLFDNIKKLKKCDFPNIQIASELFISLLTDVHYDRVCLNLLPPPSLADIQSHVVARIKIFLKIYPLIDS